LNQCETTVNDIQVSEVYDDVDESLQAIISRRLSTQVKASGVLIHCDYSFTPFEVNFDAVINLNVFGIFSQWLDRQHEAYPLHDGTT
jgi:hypothetical protein